MDNSIYVILFVTVLLYAIYVYSKKRICPECGKPLPRVRIPKDPKQILQGGWVCANCGCRIDRRGNKQGVKL